MKSTENIIDLEDYRVIDKDGSISKVFTGRDRGEYVRKTSKLDEIAEKYQKVVVIIPDKIYSINPSFFEELFVNVVLKLGRDGFYEKFEFIVQGNYKFEKPLSEAIARILRKRTAIG